MLGIVIATHGKLSSGLKDAAEVIMGSVTNIATVSLNHGEDIQLLGEQLIEAIQEVNQGDGVIILTDVTSASPYNQSLIVINQLAGELNQDIYVLTGANLPMLLETINHQILETPVEQAAKAVLEQGLSSMSLWHISMVEDESEADEF